MAQKIFDSSSHPFQTMSATILSDLYDFFNRHNNNFIKFWECPSHLKWHLHCEVNKETKFFNLTPLFLCKSSNWLTIQTCYMLTQWEPLQITLLLVNTGLGSSWEKNLGVHAVVIWLNQDNISFMNVLDLMTIGTQEETCIVILSCFWCLTQMHFHFVIH